MSVFEIDAVLDELIGSGVVPADEMVGCSDLEIQELMNDQDVYTLPPSYVRFLERAGHKAGRILVGSRAFYPDLLGVKTVSAKLLIKDSASWTIGETDFFIQMHQGYQIFWFDVSIVDPEIWMYTEGEERPTRLTANFLEYLKGSGPWRDDYLDAKQL